MKLSNRNRSVLVADSGSTKTDWVLLDEMGRKSFQTQGLNPVLMSEEAMVDILRCELLPELPDDGNFEVFFYGAGVRPDQLEKMNEAFQKAFAAGSPFAAIAPHSTLHTSHSTQHPISSVPPARSAAIRRASPASSERAAIPVFSMARKS